MGALSYKGIGQASVSGRRNKLDQDGDYAVQLDAIKEAVSIELGGKRSYVIELTVLESNNPRIRVGEERSVTINRLDSDLDYEVMTALGNLKNFLAAALTDLAQTYVDPEVEVPPGEAEDFWEKTAEKSMLDDGAFFRGAKMRVKVQRIDTKKTKALRKEGASEEQIAQRMFPRTTFRPYDSALVPA
jgi:hypothetical protein